MGRYRLDDQTVVFAVLRVHVFGVCHRLCKLWCDIECIALDLPVVSEQYLYAHWWGDGPETDSLWEETVKVSGGDYTY